MKTIKFLVTLALLTIVGNTYADNLAVEDFTIAPGETKTFSIELNNPNSPYIMVEFWMSLPEGVSIPMDDDGYYMAEGNASRFTRSHTLEVNEQDGYYHFLIFSSRNVALEGNSGELVSVSIEAATDAEAGTYEAKIINQLYNDPDKNEVTPEDVSFNITIEAGDGRIHFAETDTSLPIYTAGEKGDITMARTINAGEWSTIVLPFNLMSANATKAFGDDVQFAKFTGFEVDYGDDEENVTPLAITVQFSSYTIPPRGNLAGGTPVLIKTGKNISEIKLDGVTLVSTVTNVETADADYGFPGKFIGTFVKTTVPEDGLFLSGNKFWYSTGKTNIKAFRGWFELGAVLNKESDFGANLNFVIDGDPTSIDGIPGNMIRKGDVYTIQGQYVGHDVDMKRLPSGIYIINGKKMVVK
ncbi:MAG: hypothetical protein IJM04_10230 [Prevotella sp.]|nr:hypothetical protein [Prevotella sp.]